jgi:hypothetical protein
VSCQHLCISADKDGALTIKDTSKYGTVVSYEESEHQGDSGGWGSLWHCVPPSSQEQNPALGQDTLAEFSETIQLLARPLGTDIDGNRLRESSEQGIRGRDKVSIKSFYSSMNSLKGLVYTGRSKINNIINEYAPYDVETDFEGFKKTINEIRRNRQLRCRLLEFFEKKLEAIRRLSPYSLSERVYYNDLGNLKHPNHPGYPDKMTSSEYAVVLALSMIDGSFDPDSDSKDQVKSGEYKDGTPMCGQYREAARKILFDVEADLWLQANLRQEDYLL